MKVEAIRLINFMAFEDTGWIELRPITLLFGRNSSGKSALIRALLLLKQSLDAADEQEPLVFVKENGLVDLGDFTVAVHRQEKDDRSLIFGFRCDATGEALLDDVKAMVRESQAVRVSPERIEDLRTVELLFGFGWYEEAVRPNLLRLSAVLDDASGDANVCIIECVSPDDPEVQKSFVINSDVVHETDLDGRTVGLHRRDAVGFWTTFANPVPTSFSKVDRLLSDIQNAVSDFLRGIVHIGPIRPQPERTSVIRDIDRPRLEREGLSGWYQFLRDEIDASQSGAIDEWMTKLGLASARTRAMKFGSDSKPSHVTLSQVVVADSGLNVNIRDVGFGASQVLPVVVAAVLAKPGSLVIIEQPELHLHTSAQVELGGLFVQAQRSGVRFLLETHSEHLLLRFQRSIARNELLRLKCERRRKRVAGHKQRTFKPVICASDAIALLVKRSSTEACSQLEAIPFQQDGQLSNPSDDFRDFFQQDYDEVNAILETSAQIRLLQV